MKPSKTLLKKFAEERRTKYAGQFVELVPDPFNTGYEEMKAQKEREAGLKKRVKL